MHELEAPSPCPVCGRVKGTLRQVGGVEGPPTDDRRSVVVCDVCGEIYLFAGARGSRLPSDRVLGQILRTLPPELALARGRIQRHRWAVVDAAVREALKMRRPMYVGAGELAEVLEVPLGFRLAVLEAARALVRLEVQGLAVRNDEANETRWAWLGGV